MPKVLVVATSRKTKGGITSVVKHMKQENNGKSFIVNGLKHIGMEIA